MENFSSFLTGVSFGCMLVLIIFIVASPKKEIIVTINTDKKTGELLCNFKSNRNNEGDTYIVTIDGDTISSGVVIDGVWR